jgi:hypothetical protein
MKNKKDEIVTFKADADLIEAMNRLPNRSEFIRSAVLHAMDSVCPLCTGTGIMTLKQKEHWINFQQDHKLEECHDCHEIHIVCNRSSVKRELNK